METDLGQASQDELNVVTAAMAAVAHDIKLETGDAIDNKLTVADSKSFTVYPQASSASYGDDSSLFSSYTSSADSEHGLGDQPLSMQVHFPTLQLASLDQTPPAEQSCPVPLTSSQPAVPFTNGQTSDLFAISETFDLSACSQPSVSCSTSSQSSVPFAKFLPSVPLASSPPSKSFSSRSVVSFTNSQSSTFLSSQRSSPVTSSQPSVNCSQPSAPFISSQPSDPVVSSQPSVNCSQPSVPFISSQPSVPVVSSQPSAPSASPQPSAPSASPQPSALSASPQPSAPSASPQPSAPSASPQPSAPSASPQPSAPTASPQPSAPTASPQPSAPSASPQPSAPTASPQPLAPSASPQPSAPSASPQPSLSATWYKQPSSVPLFHSHAVPSALSSVSAGQQTSKAASQQARRGATSSPPLAAVPTRESQRTRADCVRRGAESSGEKGDQNDRVSVASSCRDVSENEDQKSEVMAQVLTQSGRLTRQAARACAERVERTTRILRARQSAKTSPEKEKDTNSSTASEKPDASHVPSPLPNSQQLEMLPPAAQELRPRRMTRKPRHTQRVWRPEVRGQPFDKWRIIGQTQGLTSDTEIAVFLMQHYENAMSGQPSGICVNCQAILTLTCTACQSTSRPSETIITSLGVPSAHANMEHMEVKAKTEPIDPVHHDPSPQREIDVELQMGPDPEKEEPEEEMAVFFEAGHVEEQEEEEKPPTRRRKRGRPRGSGKKSAEKAGGPRMKAKANKYKCTYDGCDAAFAKSSRLKVHTRIHTGEKPYVCKDCGKAFTQKSGLTVHSQKHTGLRPFTCQECGTSFPSSSTLKQHMRRHTGEKPFVCKKCNKRFRWSGHLTQHLRMHDGIKPFLCPDCGKSFSASSDLAKHRVTHTKSRPYKCDRCDKAYSFQHRLTAHQRSHTGDRPFLCSECGAAFSRAHNLTVHMRTHTGDKPYWCKDCGAKFSDSGNFCKHKKTKHGESTKNTPAMKRTADTAEPVPDQPANLGGSKLLDYEFLVGMGRGGKSADAAGKLPSIDKVAVSKMRKGRSPDTHRLPSMAKVASRAKLERDRRKGVALGGVALTSTPSLNSSISLPTSLPADFKNILPPVGGDSLETSLPSHFSPIGSPPALPVQNRLSVSPAVVSLPPPHGSPGPGVSSDSSLSVMTQSGHEMSEYQASQPDGVVFPPQYYGSYPYYCQQQE